VTADGEPPAESESDGQAGLPGAEASGQTAAEEHEPEPAAEEAALAPAEEPRPPQGDGDSLSPLSRSGFIEYDRILFFSDAVFAIAITLLAVTLHVPQHPKSVGHELQRAEGSLLGFVISFAAIALFWLAHHSMFRYIKAFDRTLIVLNLLFLGTIAFLPYPTEILSHATGNQPGAAIFYALCAGIAGLLEGLLWVYATRRGSPLVYEMPAEVKLHYTLRAIRAPVVFFISIPIALVGTQWAEYSWLLIWVLAVLINRLSPAPGTQPSGEPEARRSRGYSPLPLLRRSTRR
jgi:uncharacterized membrane protein